MSLPLTLNVALSLIFAYFLAASLASAVNEVIAGMLKLRGLYLTKAIEALTSLGNNSKLDWGGAWGWIAAVWSQSAPNFSQTARDAEARVKEAAAAEASGAAVAVAVRAIPRLAADLPALDKQLEALTIAPATPQAVAALVSSFAGVTNLQAHPLIAGSSTALPSYVPARDFATALLGVLKDGSGATGFATVRGAIDKLPDGDLKTILQGFVSAGADDIDKLRARIENWFDDAMERAGGIYKRFTQYVMLGLGLAIAVVFNVDSVHMAQALWNQPALSQMIADEASTYGSANRTGCTPKPPPEPSSAAPAGTDPKVPAAAAPSAATPAGGSAASQTNACGNIDAWTKLLGQQQLPIGRGPDADFFNWPPSPTMPGQTAAPVLPAGKASPDHAPGQTCWMVTTIIGWFITAVAISLGAQFWFGLLTEVAGLRSSGRKPVRANAK